MKRLLLILLATTALLLPACATAPEKALTERTQVLPVLSGAPAESTPAAKQNLTLVSINLAHGRKDSLNQLLVSDGRTRKNLDDIATFLREIDADVVALQEADSASPWSGEFDHVAYLAQAGGYPWYVYTEHAQIWLGNYGTALLSRWPIKSAQGVTFPSTPPTASKGFTVAQIEWGNGNGRHLVDMVSVHLDFSRKSVRREQMDELVAVLKPRHESLVIMGDFNSEWLAKTYLVESFADSSRMQVYNPASTVLNTYKDKRLDWILVSRELAFESYRVAPEILSDHLAVVAVIRLDGYEDAIDELE